MAALFVLLAVAFGLLALAAIGRIMPARVPVLRAILCVLGIGAALLAPTVAVFELGATLAIDGLSTAALTALLLLGACGSARPLTLGLLALALLAGDAAGLLVCVGLAAALDRAPGSNAWSDPGQEGKWRLQAGGVACLAAGLLLLGWSDGLRFAAIRAMPPGSIAAAAVPVLAIGAALLLGPALGGVTAVYLAARLLLDLPGPATPGWWGVPVLAAGMGGALAMARRAAAADDLAAATTAIGHAVMGLAGASLGVALLARGADLPPLAAVAVAACLMLLVAWGVWGGLLLLATGAIRGAAGTTVMARLGGLLRRMPTAGLALLVGLASAAALPLSPGFAAAWLLLQALLAAARSGGTAVLALVAAGVATTGLLLALLGAAALRIAGLTLLGAARSARAAAAPEAPGGLRLGMAVLGVAAVALGVLPWLGMDVVQPGVRLLAGVAAEGASLWTLGAAAEPVGYAAPALTLLLCTCIGAAAWVARGPGQPVSPWRGGLGEDAPGRTFALVLWPGWRTWRPVFNGRTLLLMLGFALALALGWAAR